MKKDDSIFVEFIHCKDCTKRFKNYFSVLAVEHYNNRKNVVRCIGCSNLQKFYRERVVPCEKRKRKVRLTFTRKNLK